ncbi:MAG: ABC transporter ATP-binding protein [Lachnospiraceae bacterium]|nr:ABC transporter ATP-binding protein [Lachnospiraceae bacterium]
MRKSIIYWVLGKIRNRIGSIIVMALANVGSSLLGVLFALNSRQLIDRAVTGDRQLFLYACILQILLIAGMLFCVSMTRILREKILAQLDRDWKKELLHNLLCGDYADVSAYHSGELINRMTNDVRILDEGIVSIVPNLSAMLTKLIAASVVLIGLEPLFGAVILAAGSVVMLVIGLMRQRIKILNKEVSQADGHVSGMIQEVLEKLLIVQALDVSREVERRADKLMEQRFRVQMRRKNVSLFANTAVSILSYAASFGTLVYAAAGLLYGTISFGELTALTQLVSQLQGPVVQLSSFYPQYAALTAAAERLKELFDLKANEDLKAENEINANFTDITEYKSSNLKGLYEEMTCLGAEKISYTYGRNQVLDHASFQLPKGSFSVVTGNSGIGKSTLLKLLMGIYQPDEGMLYFRRKGAAEQECIKLTKNLRKLFAYVPQGNLLLSGTLKENLLLTNPEATKEEIENALWVSDMVEYVAELPQGLDTVLKENAGGLSEGQAQRLSIARAILSGAPVLLLDEATSALDEATEQKVLTRIKSLKNRTCIMVTHRPAAVKLCDYRLEIAGMKIEEIKVC